MSTYTVPSFTRGLPFNKKQNRPLNSEQLTRESRVDLDQPGCVHANMDLFKWALQLWPMLPSEDLVDALELAVSCRVLVGFLLGLPLMCVYVCLFVCPFGISVRSVLTRANYFSYLFLHRE